LRADGLDDHEVLVLSSNSVDLHGFEEVVGGVAHDGGVCGAEVTGEVANWHAGAVDLAVVAAEEEIHVLAISDDSLVDGTGTRGVGDLAGEERLCCSPSVSVRWISGRSVCECRWTPLVGKDPDALGCEVEDRWCDCVDVHAVLGSGCHLGPVAEETKDHGSVPCTGVMVRGVDKMLAIVECAGEILEGNPSGLGGRERTSRAPFV